MTTLSNTRVVRAEDAQATIYPPGYFSEPVRAWKQMRFEPQIVVSRRTGRMETDFERQQRIRQASWWNTLPMVLAGSLK